MRKKLRRILATDGDNRLISCLEIYFVFKFGKWFLFFKVTNENEIDFTLVFYFSIYILIFLFLFLFYSPIYSNGSNKWAQMKDTCYNSIFVFAQCN